MTITDLEDSLESIFTRGFKIEIDDEGQLIIHTGLIENEEGELVSIVETEENDDDDDDDEESNIISYDESDNYSDY